MNTEYQQMYTNFCEGVITLQEWQEYCEKILLQLMYHNQGVFIRLKDR